MRLASTDRAGSHSRQLLLAAGVVSAVVAIYVLVLPTENTTEIRQTSGRGVVVEDRSVTLFEQEGATAAAFAGLPLVGSAASMLALRSRQRRLVQASVAVILLTIAILAAASVGFLLVPVGILVALAAYAD